MKIHKENSGYMQAKVLTLKHHLYLLLFFRKEEALFLGM